jgi:hypothetical protein
MSPPSNADKSVSSASKPKSQEQNAVSPVQVERLSLAKQCPVCGGDNQCRVAKGQLYKGPCRCEGIIVSGHILHSLTTDRFELACLCRFCLETLERLCHERDDAAAVLSNIPERLENSRLPGREEEYYVDENGRVVFTAAYHLRRGACCGNGCRHCPF